MTRPSRRQFVQGVGVAGLGLVVGCGRLPFQAQPPAKVHRIGFLAFSRQPYQETFQQGLHQLGYMEGRNVTIEYRFAEKDDRFPDLATELVRLPVDVLVAAGTPGSQAAKNATSTIPVVSVASADPVGLGIVASLAHPGGNITGVTIFSPQLSGKRLDLLKEAVPGVSRVAVLWNPDNPATALSIRQLQPTAEALGLELLSVEVRGLDDFESAFEAASRANATALLTIADPLTNRERTKIVNLAARNRLPAMYELREHVVAGGLMAYGANIAGLHRRAADYVDKILKGTKPADLPVEQPREFDFVINLRTAQALGLTLPESVLVQATELIQ